MFPRLRQRFGNGVLARLDVLLELSTLGEYGVSEEGRPLALADLAEHGEHAPAPPTPPTRQMPRTRDICSPRCVATARVSTATRRRGAPPARS